MFCPECGLPTDPAPFNPHGATWKPRSFALACRGYALSVLNTLQRPFKSLKTRSASCLTKMNHLKEGSIMAKHHAAAGEVMKISPISESGIKTSALVKADSFEAIHLVLRAGEHIPDHKIGGSISLYCIEGDATIDTPDGERLLCGGDWLYLGPGTPHAVRGITDASLILTVFFDRPALHTR